MPRRDHPGGGTPPIARLLRVIIVRASVEKTSRIQAWLHKHAAACACAGDHSPAHPAPAPSQSTAGTPTRGFQCARRFASAAARRAAPHVGPQARGAASCAPGAPPAGAAGDGVRVGGVWGARRAPAMPPLRNPRWQRARSTSSPPTGRVRARVPVPAHALRGRTRWRRTPRRRRRRAGGGSALRCWVRPAALASPFRCCSSCEWLGGGGGGGGGGVHGHACLCAGGLTRASGRASPRPSSAASRWSRSCGSTTWPTPRAWPLTCHTSTPRRG